MEISEGFKYRKMLIKLADGLRENDLSNMKFVCREHITRRRLEEITDGLLLWEALEERELLGKENLSYLKTLIHQCADGNKCLLSIIEEYENGRAAEKTDRRIVQPTDACSGPDLQKEIDWLASGLGRSWRDFVRHLHVSDSEIDAAQEEYPRNVREQIRKCIQHWLLREKGASKTQLIQALKSCERSDLAHQLECGDY